MGVRKKYDLAVKTGEYQSNGETKSTYENIGAVMEGDNGPFILLKRSFNPAGVPAKGDRVVVSCFEPRDQTGQGQGQRSSGNGGGQRQAQSQGGGSRYSADDEIPF